MAELHEALKALSPTEWSDVPLDDLDAYMTALLSSGELICNSIPPPAEGTAFHEAKPHFEQPNGATSHKDVHPSTARSYPPGKEHEDLQKNWGKAMKFSAKENPLNIAVYKMAGHDRHGAWFARRSVHEGLGFTKFKNAMKREFAESMAVEGGPGSGSIRGIGVDTRLERREVEGVGALEVYQLSAQFPGPTTPREFIPLLITSDNAMTNLSAAKLSNGSSHVPRSHMILSRPITHPDAPERPGYIRGKYESVELIREIPLAQSKSGDSEGDPELNPVEWIMITRSDPGGGIPRFMVDRGTPSTMLGDVHKWLDWATVLNENEELGTQAPDKGPADTEETKSAEADGNKGLEATADPTARKRASTEPVPQQEGVVSHLTQALEAGIDAYAPTMVSSYMHGRMDSQDIDSDSSSVSSSSGSFMSANERHSVAAAEDLPVDKDSPAASSQVSLASVDTKSSKNLTQHDKEVIKLAKQRDKLDRKLAKKRQEEEARLKKTMESENGEQEKAKERHEREVKKSEERHRREMEKLEAKKEKEARKAEEKRQKRDERGIVSRVTRERDEFRSQAELLKREVELLHQQVGELQKENTGLASRLGQMGVTDVGNSAARRSSASLSSRSRENSKTKK